MSRYVSLKVSNNGKGCYNAAYMIIGLYYLGDVSDRLYDETNEHMDDDSLDITYSLYSVDCETSEDVRTIINEIMDTIITLNPDFYEIKTYGDHSTTRN
ncbi:MAG: hypothetical protein RSC68_17320 [Acinetobacter sp.]